MKRNNGISLYEQINEILWNDWDPIGIKDIAPHDEYSGYTTTIYRLKTNGVDKETIANTLNQIETDTIGLTGNMETCLQVAEKIIKLK